MRQFSRFSAMALGLGTILLLSMFVIRSYTVPVHAAPPPRTPDAYRCFRGPCIEPTPCIPVMQNLACWFLQVSHRVKFA